MNRFLMATAVAAAFLSSGAYAASSKFAAHVSDVLITNSAAGGQGSLHIPIKTANKSDLLVGVSLQSTVLTETKTKGRNGDTNFAAAEGKVEVCLSVTGDYEDLAPDCVVFEMRRQELTTVLSGVIDCPTEDTVDFDDFCTIVDDEEVNLLLKTMSANHFNFVVRNVSSGNHIVTATVTGSTDLDCDTSADESCRAEVAVGPGSITVEEVRATNDGTTIIFD
jgi:hypothetical protein